MNSNQIFDQLLLKSTQSVVRTTVTLSNEANFSLQWITSELDIAIKDIVDSMLGIGINGEMDQNECLDNVLSRINSEPVDKEKLLVKKTLSLSKQSLETLKELAREHRVTRDILINHIVLYSKFCLQDIVKKRYEVRAKLADRIEKWKISGKSILDLMQNELGETDLMTQQFARILDSINDLHGTNQQN